MVLDSIVNGEFIFKTSSFFFDNKVKVPVASQAAPDEFYFVHIKLTQATIEKGCLAVSCALMLQNSCKVLIEQCHECGIITDERKSDCLKLIKNDEFQFAIRSRLIEIMLPRLILKDAVVRVSIELKFNFLILSFRSPTQLS